MMLLLRAVLSWIMPYNANAVTMFLYRVTEPIISPVRQLTYRIPFFRNCPIDLSFLIVVILLGVAENLLLFGF